MYGIYFKKNFEINEKFLKINKIYKCKVLFLIAN